MKLTYYLKNKVSQNLVYEWITLCGKHILICRNNIFGNHQLLLTNTTFLIPIAGSESFSVSMPQTLVITAVSELRNCVICSSHLIVQSSLMIISYF